MIKQPEMLKPEDMEMIRQIIRNTTNMKNSDSENINLVELPNHTLRELDNYVKSKYAGKSAFGQQSKKPIAKKQPIIKNDLAPAPIVPPRPMLTHQTSAPAQSRTPMGHLPVFNETSGAAVGYAPIPAFNAGVPSDDMSNSSSSFYSGRCWADRQTPMKTNLSPSV